MRGAFWLGAALLAMAAGGRGEYVDQAAAPAVCEVAVLTTAGARARLFVNFTLTPATWQTLAGAQLGAHLCSQTVAIKLCALDVPAAARSATLLIRASDPALPSGEFYAAVTVAVTQPPTHAYWDSELLLANASRTPSSLWYNLSGAFAAGDTTLFAVSSNQAVVAPLDIPLPALREAAAGGAGVGLVLAIETQACHTSYLASPEMANMVIESVVALQFSVPAPTTVTTGTTAAPAATAGTTTAQREAPSASSPAATPAAAVAGGAVAGLALLVGSLGLGARWYTRRQRTRATRAALLGNGP